MSDKDYIQYLQEVVCMLHIEVNGDDEDELMEVLKMDEEQWERWKEELRKVGREYVFESNGDFDERLLDIS